MKSLLNNIIRILLTIQCWYCPSVFALDKFETSDYYGNEPIFAHVIFRHGERNIERSYPNDPYINETHWTGGFGALTNNGKTEVYKLGKYLRQRYNKLVGEKYSKNAVYIHSTDFDRTLMSAQVLAASLFPPVGNEIWSADIKWQPIPVHSQPLNQELLMPHSIPCARFRYLFGTYINSPEYKAVFQKHRSLIQYWEEKSGKSLKVYSDFLHLYDTLYIEHQKGLHLPKWASDALHTNNTLKYLALFEMMALTHSTELKKLEAGFFIKEILDRFTNKSLETLKPDRSLWLYAAHDVSMINILIALNLYDSFTPLFRPFYASSLHFELYQNAGNFSIQMFFRQTNKKAIVPLKIPNCGTPCSLNTFYKLYRDILPTKFEDYNLACKHPQKENNQLTSFMYLSTSGGQTPINATFSHIFCIVLIIRFYFTNCK